MKQEDIAILTREVKIPIVPPFADWDKINTVSFGMDSSKSIKHTVLPKSGTIGILTYLEKMPISPDCTIQID